MRSNIKGPELHSRLAIAVSLFQPLTGFNLQHFVFI